MSTPQPTASRNRPAAALAAATDGALRYCLAVFLVAVAGWLLLGVLGVGLIPSGRPVSVPGLAAQAPVPGWHNAFTAGERQDALWYLRIAAHGYRAGDGSAAFFPLYPLLVRAVALLPGVGLLAAAVAVAWAGYFGGLVAFYRLGELEFGARVARRAVLLLATFPTAFFFLAPYTEGLFLGLSVGSCYSARRGRWLLAGGLAALAASTRSIGVLLAPALAVEAWLQWRAGRRRPVAPLLAAAGPLLGLGAYLAYWAAAFGDALAPWQAQQNWQRVPAPPWVTLWHAALDAYRYTSYWLIDALVVAVVLAAVVVAVRTLRPTYWVYAVASLLLPLCEPFPPRPLMSLPRFVVVVFPAFWVLARALERRRLPGSVLAAPFAGGFALLGLLFVNWQPIF